MISCEMPIVRVTPSEAEEPPTLPGMRGPFSNIAPGPRDEVRDTLPCSTRPPLLRRFSSQWPAANVDEEPSWGIKASVVGPCATCGRPTRWYDTAHGDQYHFCSERCLDERLELELQILMPPTK